MRYKGFLIFVGTPSILDDYVLSNSPQVAAGHFTTLSAYPCRRSRAGRSLYAYTLKRQYVNKPVHMDACALQAGGKLDEILTAGCLAILRAALHHPQCVFKPVVNDCDQLGQAGAEATMNHI